MSANSLLTKVFLITLTGFFLISCASSYKVPKPSDLNFITQTSNDGLILQYRYDILESKYAKKELRKGIKIIAVKITNNSGKDYIFGKDLTLEYSSGREVHFMDRALTYKSIKQGSAIYSLYLLMTPLNLYTYSTNSYGLQEETSSTPIGLVLGPGLALVNILKSSSANRKFKEQLQDYDLIGKQIVVGETVYGIIPIKTASFDALHLKLLKN
ncbi:hypothetical protein V1387_04370 [Allomuricauda taeanensis]|uniref:hypothetical protein n=1 Tax=Flagellimonas taeanensis TaxID=1005926 RepID=UPI002E7B80CA|nr:hypothetical protein [Allomuricauda taeanensis]MEE1961910.1 hypothetical protein [Allomuricauda taeanensis]